jgi:DNA-binding MarR family transcriptional regulator
MKTNETFLRFLELTKLLEKTTTLPLLEPVEKRMLKIVALANIKNKRLSVKDMMTMSDISSPATMHKNIHALVDKGWIFLEETEDARRWQLQLTKETLKYFDKLGLVIQKSTK